MSFDNFPYEPSEFEETVNRDTLDEGVVLGGMRSKYEIRTLICYLFFSVGKPMDKELIIESILKKGLANYFEASSCFDDLLKRNNLELVDSKDGLYFITDNGKMVAKELENTIATTVKERAYSCAIELLEKRRIEKENTVTISKIDKGYNVNFVISGGDVNLMSFDLYAPDLNQAKLMKKNFYKCPDLIYKSIIGCLTRNKELVNEALMDISLDF